MLSASLDSELRSADALALKVHLRSCDHCQSEYEQLRLAKRALLHFEIPKVNHRNFRVDEWSLTERVRTPPLLGRLGSRKISMPAPVAAGLLIVFCSAMFLVARSTVSQTTPPSGQATITRTIEVPIERVVTRTVYVELRGYARERGRRGSTKTATTEQSASNGMMRVARHENNGGWLASQTLKGFRPVDTANLRIVSEPEQ